MKNVFITGASSGFGKLSVKKFADKGYNVFATMRNPEEKNKNNRLELEGYSSNIHVLDMDVTDDLSVTNAVNKVFKMADNIDILINNAGIMYIGLTEAYSVSQAHELMNTNYYGVIRVIQAILPKMRAVGKGLIINTTSVVGRVSFPFGGIYNASKFALEAYSQSLKYEVANKGVEVVMVEPGPFGTGLINSIKKEDHNNVLEENKDLVEIRTNMLQQFTKFLSEKDAPKPSDVAEAYINLSEMEHGKRPTRTVVGIDYGAIKINELTQPIQDESLNTLGMDFMLETKII